MPQGGHRRGHRRPGADDRRYLPVARRDRRIGALAAPKIKEGYEAIALATDDGKVIQGYPLEKTEREIVVTEATTGAKLRIRQVPSKRSARSAP